MSGEVPIEIEDKPTAVSIMRELVEHLQDTIEALKREIVRNPKSHEYSKALKASANVSPSPSKFWRVKRQECRTRHRGSNALSYGPAACRAKGRRFLGGVLRSAAN